MRKSLKVSLIAVFGSLHAVLYFLSFGLPWRNWGVYLETIEGVLLGPQVGFAAALIGSFAARAIRPDSTWMFGIIAEPFSVLFVGLLVNARWKVALASYIVMLGLYFAHPFGTALPIWTVLDVLAALLLIYPASRLSRNLLGKDAKSLSIALVLLSFVCIATDSLVRIFLLVPVGLHSLLFENFAALNLEFARSAVFSYVEDLMAVLISVTVGVPLIMYTAKLKIMKEK